MEFAKGYLTEENIFISEGSTVKVVLKESGELVTGFMIKPSKKEFRILIDEMVRVLTVDEVESIEEIIEQNIK